MKATQGIDARREPFRSGSYFPTEEAKARWLLRLMSANLAELTPGELIGMSRDAAGFISPAFPDPNGPEPDAALLRELQAALVRGWRKLNAGEWWALEGRIGYGIARMGPGRGRIIRGERQGRFADLFQAAALDLMQEHWSRLETCPKCGVVFLKVGKQEYCSPTCSQKVRWQRFAAKAKRARDYRAERTNAIRKRTGANVKLGRRRGAG
jgi:hypothetical protein